MKTAVYARRELIGPRAFALGPAVLLEGAWPHETAGCLRWSLDDAVDGRFEWIDAMAADLVEELLEIAGGLPSGLYPTADLNVLDLQYYLVKLIRITAYFTKIRPLQSGGRLDVFLCRGRDEYLHDLFQEIAASAGAEYEPKWSEPLAAVAKNRSSKPRSSSRRALADERPGGFPKNGRFRRFCGRLARLIEPGKNIASHRRRVVLCGDSRALAPIADKLLADDCQIWWLHDRFAVDTWLRWRFRGAGQLFCNSSLGHKNRLTANLPQQLMCLGVNLAPAVGRWLAEIMQKYGRRQTRAVREINAHFRRVRPHRIVLGDESTPFARAAVAVARRHGVASFVVQTKMPCRRFAFAPIAADHVLAWGPSSKEQFLAWGALPQQVHVTGSPRHGSEADGKGRPRIGNAALPTQVIWGKASRATGLLRTLALSEIDGSTTAEAARELLSKSATTASSGPNVRPIKFPKVLLLAPPLPDDSQPGSVAMHLNRTTYAEILRTALAAVARVDGARLEIRLPNRTAPNRVLKSVLGEFKSLHVEFSQNGGLPAHVARADCVLSCMSADSAEATLAGVPVVQVLPQGSADVMPYNRWGMIGSAKTQDELEQLLAKLLREGWKPLPPVNGDVFAKLNADATAETVRAILEKTPLQRRQSNLSRQQYAATRHTAKSS